MASDARQDVGGPQHAIDVALVHSALARARARADAARLNGRQLNRFVGPLATLRSMQEFARTLGRNPWGTLSRGQRAFAEDLCGIVEVSRIRALHTGEPTPEVLKHLPKRPPQRRVEAEEDAAE